MHCLMKVQASCANVTRLVFLLLKDLLLSKGSLQSSVSIGLIYLLVNSPIETGTELGG